jgi:endonuclease/exonuclease/phosphatase family metal-dependent hydrolase
MPLRIATFNLKDFFLPRSDAERAVSPAKFANIVGQLTRANADVVALQEVGEPAQIERLVAQLGGLGYGPAVLGTADKRGIRCAILSRLPVVWSQIHTRASLPFPSFVEGDADPFADRITLRRGIVHVRVESPDFGEVDVMTAHFKSNLPASKRTKSGVEIVDTSARARAESAVRSLAQRAAEAIFVRGLVDELLAAQKAQKGRAVCVLGDLNDHEGALPVRIVRGIGESGPDTLFPCASLVPAESRFSCFHGEEKTLIDHVLVSDTLFSSLKRFEIYNERLRSHGGHAVAALPTEDSDHALCVAEFVT